MKPIKIYICRCGQRCGNFGDMMTVELVEKMSGRSVQVFDKSEDIPNVDLVATGSIAQFVPPDYTGTIWGSGLMFEHGTLRASKARVLALRGHLTSKRSSVQPATLGDPGWLYPCVCAPDLLKPCHKRHRLGLLLHYVDYDNQGIWEYIKTRPEVTVIDPCGRVRDAFQQISECDVILSSSLHGLVAADALAVPNAWMRLSDGIAGGFFKFRDYLSVFGIDDPLPYWFNNQPVEGILEYIFNSWTRPGLPDLIKSLRNSFPSEWRGL